VSLWRKNLHGDCRRRQGQSRRERLFDRRTQESNDRTPSAKFRAKIWRYRSADNISIPAVVGLHIPCSRPTSALYVHQFVPCQFGCRAAFVAAVWLRIDSQKSDQPIMVRRCGRAAPLQSVRLRPHERLPTVVAELSLFWILAPTKDAIHSHLRRSQLCPIREF
jgi:hypothetical protein